MNKTALITGASSGIGLELARIHASKGGNLIITARRKEKLATLKDQLEQEYGITVSVIACDLSQPGAAQELYKQVKNNGHKIDFLMNNAGFGLGGKFHELELDRQQQMIQLNVNALVELTYYFLPDLIKKGSGKILNTSSTASLMPGPLQAVYFATKAFVTSFSNAIAEELKGTGVTVTNLMPGATKTEFAAQAELENAALFQKTASAYDVALDGYNAMIDGKLDVISGVTTSQKIMMNLAPLVPKSIILKQVKKLQEV